METSLTLAAVAALLGAMFALAAVPDASALAVVARSLASGFRHGLVTVLGILAGDFLFIAVAVMGWSAVSRSHGALFGLLELLGAGYLLWLGVSLWRAPTTGVEVEEVAEPSWTSNFLCGLLITIGDPKAILFYASFLPAFVDLATVSVLDVGIVMACAAFTVGTVKMGYAVAASRTRALFEDDGARRRMNLLSGAVMMGTGLYLLLRP